MFMDLLFNRYADPFSLLDGYILTSRMSEFVLAFLKQKKEDDKWQFFLHKVWNKSWDDFCRDSQTSQGERGMTEEEIKATYMESVNILGNFNPYEEEGEV